MDASWEEDYLTGRWAAFKDEPNHGWIAWGGASPPFNDGEVDVRLRSGRLILFRHPHWIGRRQNAEKCWAHLGDRQDFIYYRRHARAIISDNPDEVLPF